MLHTMNRGFAVVLLLLAPLQSSCNRKKPIQLHNRAKEISVGCGAEANYAAQALANLAKQTINQGTFRTSDPAYTVALDKLTAYFRVVYDARDADTNVIPSDQVSEFVVRNIQCLQRAGYTVSLQATGNSATLPSITNSLAISWAYVAVGSVFSATAARAAMAATQANAAASQARYAASLAKLLEYVKMTSPPLPGEPFRVPWVKAPYIEKAMYQAAEQLAKPAQVWQRAAGAAGAAGTPILVAAATALAAYTLTEGILILDEKYNGGRFSQGVTNSFFRQYLGENESINNLDSAKASAAKLLGAIAKSAQGHGQQAGSSSGNSLVGDVGPDDGSGLQTSVQSCTDPLECESGSCGTQTEGECDPVEGEVDLFTEDEFAFDLQGVGGNCSDPLGSECASFNCDLEKDPPLCGPVDGEFSCTNPDDYTPDDSKCSGGGTCDPMVGICSVGDDTTTNIACTSSCTDSSECASNNCDTSSGIGKCVANSDDAEGAPGSVTASCDTLKCNDGFCCFKDDNGANGICAPPATVR